MDPRSKKQILIVEDDLPLLKMFSEKMRFEGFGVFEAKDGEEGLKLALKEHPDIISLDVHMPKMDGIAMLSKLREDKWGETAPVIIWSAYRDETKLAQAKALGVTDFLVKSDWALNDIVGKIKEKLGVKN